MAIRVDFRSDTVTKPTPGMLEAMMTAKVGDDVFGEDETVVALQAKLANIFGMVISLHMFIVMKVVALLTIRWHP
jgi:threonine aldolase